MWNFETLKDDNIALVQGEVQITYKELKAGINEIRQILPERALIFCLCRNTVGSIAGYLSFTEHGCVPLLLDAKISKELLNDLIRSYRPMFFWMPTSMTGDFPDYNEVFTIFDYSLVRTGISDPYPMNEELCVLISTSGSTGGPKLVRQSYKNILANTKSIIQYLGIDEKERAITSLPMNYVYGLSVINTHIYANACLVLTELNPYAKGFWRLVNEESVTSFAGVPFTYEMMNKLKVFDKEMPTLQTLTQAGGKLAPELHKKIALWAEANNKRFVVMYGASEATARMGYLPAEFSVRKEGSMGIPIPGGRFELIDANGAPIDTPHTVGELVYFGDNVTLGYAIQGEDLIKGDENQGRLSTGDMAQYDEDGFYYIVGRKKRFLKMLGKRVNLDEVEHLLKRHLNTQDVACSGKDDELWIFITDEALMNEVMEYVYSEININRKLQKVVVIPEIPKNPSGKTLYSELTIL